MSDLMPDASHDAAKAKLIEEVRQWAAEARDREPDVEAIPEGQKPNSDWLEWLRLLEILSGP